MREISVLKERILQFLEFKGISKYEFYQKTGASNGILSQKSGLSEENTLRFLSAYPEINAEWLLTGQGSMLKSEQPQPSAGPTNDKYVAMLEENNELLKKNNCSLEKINTLQEEITQLRAEIQALKSVKSQSVRVNQPSQSIQPRR